MKAWLICNKDIVDIVKSSVLYDKYASMLVKVTDASGMSLAEYINEVMCCYLDNYQLCDDIDLSRTEQGNVYEEFLSVGYSWHKDESAELNYTAVRVCLLDPSLRGNYCSAIFDEMSQMLEEHYCLVAEDRQAALTSDSVTKDVHSLVELTSFIIEQIEKRIFGEHIQGAVFYTLFATLEGKLLIQVHYPCEHLS